MKEKLDDIQSQYVEVLPHLINRFEYMFQTDEILFRSDELSKPFNFSWHFEINGYYFDMINENYESS